MATTADTVTDELHREIDLVPPDRRASLLKIVLAYREAVDEDADDIEAALAESDADLVTDNNEVRRQFGLSALPE